MEPEFQRQLTTLARQVLENRLHRDGHELQQYDTEAFSRKGGVFVTLTKQGELRGCIGRIESDDTLFRNVTELAPAAAFDDHRFSPLSAAELAEIEIEISLLSPPRRLEGASTVEKVRQIRPRKDGVVLSAKGKRATFLPQVWESLPVREDFISDLCRKAGLPRNYWKENDMEVAVYQVEKIKERSTG